MIKAIIFDCFGVLITDALQVLRDEVRAQNPEAAQEITDIITANNRGLIEPQESNRRIAEILGITVDEFRERIMQGEIKNEVLSQYIMALRPHYKTALLSNIGTGSLQRRFTPEELVRLFDTVVASGEIGYAKPDIMAYNIAAHRLGVNTGDCVFIDDREAYCHGAERAGMKAILYTNFVQLQRELSLVLATTKH